VRIDDALLAEAKAYAARHNPSPTSVLADALRELLNRHRERTERPDVRLDVFHGDGLMPGVEIDSSARLHEFLDEEQVERLRTDRAMRLADVNVLVYAERGETVQHKACHAFVNDWDRPEYARRDKELLGPVKMRLAEAF
jgi:hypothetical protein